MAASTRSKRGSAAHVSSHSNHHQHSNNHSAAADEQKWSELQRKIKDIEEENDRLEVQLEKTSKHLFRLRLERKFLIERLQQVRPEDFVIDAALGHSPHDHGGELSLDRERDRDSHHPTDSTGPAGLKSKDLVSSSASRDQHHHQHEGQPADPKRATKSSGTGSGTSTSDIKSPTAATSTIKTTSISGPR